MTLYAKPKVYFEHFRKGNLYVIEEVLKDKILIDTKYYDKSLFEIHRCIFDSIEQINNYEPDLNEVHSNS